MLLGRFVFHTPTSPQTTPPLTPRLLISRLLSIFPNTLTQAHFLAGPQREVVSQCVCVCVRVCACFLGVCVCVLVSVKSSASPFCVNSVSYLKATSHHGFLPYRHIQPLNATSPFSCYNNKAHSFTRCPSFSFLLLLSPFVVPRSLFKLSNKKTT